MTNSNQEGQPVKMKSGKRGSNISLYVDLSEIEELDKIRWREHKSMSEIVRKAIDEYIEKHSEGNDSFRLDTWVNDSTFKAVPTILDKNKQKWIDYVNSCNESDRRDLCICCNSVLKIIASLEVKSDIQVSNNKSYDADRLRNSYDIRNKDPNTLTIYQREQLKRYLDVPRWYKQPHYVEIWTEKKAMINNLVPILRGKEVTIVPIAGFSSTPFLYDNFV